MASTNSQTSPYFCENQGKLVTTNYRRTTKRDYIECDSFSTKVNSDNVYKNDPSQSGTLSEGMMSRLLSQINDSTGQYEQKKKKYNKYNGMSEEEVAKRKLPDHLTMDLNIVFIGINPGLFSAYRGHHYAGPTNHFWKCLNTSGLIPEQMSADVDFKLLDYGIGLTNIVERTTRSSSELCKQELKDGSKLLIEKLQKFRPKVAVFNGLNIYEVFSKKKMCNYGKQSEFIEGTNTYIWVMPNSSARFALLPRFQDKVPFYIALKKFCDFLNGSISTLDEKEIIFPREMFYKKCKPK